MYERNVVLSLSGLRRMNDPFPQQFGDEECCGKLCRSDLQSLQVSTHLLSKYRIPPFIPHVAVYIRRVAFVHVKLPDPTFQDQKLPCRRRGLRS